MEKNISFTHVNTYLPHLLPELIQIIYNYVSHDLNAIVKYYNITSIYILITSHMHLVS